MKKTLVTIFIIIIAILGFFLFFKKSNAPTIDKNQPAVSKSTNPKVNGVPVETGAKMETGTP